jgi:hypothetical protein
MSSSILRQLWTVIEETQTTVLLRLSDMDLVKQVLNQLGSKTTLSSEEISTVSVYLLSRTSLIRDLAQARLA